MDGTFIVAKKGGAKVGKTKRGEGTKLLAVADHSGLLDAELASIDIEIIAPHKESRQKAKTQDGRKLRRYRRRWKVERLFAWLQNFRLILARYEYPEANYLGFVHLGCLLILLRAYFETASLYILTFHVPRSQMDTCEITKQLYQYTAIDDCTRIKVIKLYTEKNAANSLDFLEYVIEELPFPIQRIQTDRGMEFFAHEFQQRLMDYAIKFRPIKPRSPHLNGKVERTQKTDWEEFYSTVDLASPELNDKLREWQDYYNHERPHGSLKNQTPREKWWELSSKAPFYDEVEALYDDSKERFREQNYRADLELQKVKGC